MKRIAIVTGATSGAGREFVRQLDGTLYGQLDELWAVARSGEELEALANVTYAPVRPFALDLTDPASFDVLRAALAAEGEVRVSWLVNSAGCGWFGPQADADPAVVRRMVSLNCLALAETCELALPYMGDGSRIVNMSSVAAWLPLPQMGVYAATKRFVLDMTRALNEDLRGTGIHACAVCPKAMDTAFWREAGPARGLGYLLGSEKPYHMVRRAIAAAQAGRGSVITAPEMRAVCAVAQVLPYGALALAGRAALATLGRDAHVPAGDREAQAADAARSSAEGLA